MLFDGRNLIEATYAELLPGDGRYYRFGVSSIWVELKVVKWLWVEKKSQPGTKGSWVFFPFANSFYYYFYFYVPFFDPQPSVFFCFGGLKAVVGSEVLLLFLSYSST